MNGRSDGLRAADIGLLLIRVILAVVFMFHGSQKLFGAFGGPGINGFADNLAKMNVPMPEVSAVVSASTEFFGGALLLIGFLTRLVVVPMAFNMLMAILLVHRHAFAAPEGLEYPLTLGVVLVALGFTGAGRLSLDAVVWSRWRRSEAYTVAERETSGAPASSGRHV